MIPLPVDRYIPAIVRAVATSRAAVVTAAPGAGKTTRIPPALLDAGPLVLLQPRRVAARAIASRIADEQGWTTGQEVGWQVRSDARRTRDTRLLVVTEGILTRFFQSDPLLSSFNTVVLDEFHERSIHADLAIAFARQAWQARNDLRLVVMSATIDADVVARFLDGCPVIAVPGTTHPVEVEYAAGQPARDGVLRGLARTAGDILCFLPGASEIARTVDELRSRVPDTVDLIPLHGALDANEQAAAIQPSRPGRRRVVVATNIAETSITVPGVTAVVDSGLQKVARYDSTRGIDSLDVERISLDAADQRAGRAGRTGPGFVCRLWDARDRLKPHRSPDIDRVDLSGPILDVLAWGASPRSLEWFERPPEEKVLAALDLLRKLGAVDGESLTALGREMNRYPLHPRLARMLIAADGAPNVVRACALLAERRYAAAPRASTSSDLLSAVDDWHAAPPHVHRAAADIAARAASLDERSDRNRRAANASESEFLRAVLAAYPDRVAQRRAGTSDRLKLSSGTGAVLARDSGVRTGEFLVAVDVRSRADARGGPTADDGSIVHLASLVEREWLVPNRREAVHRFDESTKSVRASMVESYDALVLGETPIRPDPVIAADLLTGEWKQRGVPEEDRRLLRRLQFAGVAIDRPALVRAAAHGANSLDEIELRRALTGEQRRLLDRDAPETLMLPSGRAVPVDYAEDGTPAAAAKLQELFGLAETPRLGRARVPVRLTLLAPNGWPVQVTRDLRSFWSLYISRGAPRASRPISQTPVAGRPVDGDPDGANDEAPGS